MQFSLRLDWSDRLVEIIVSALSEIPRIVRFTTFETSLRDIDNLLQNWDRTTGNVTRTDTPKSENFEETIPVPSSTRRGREKKDKEKELREREKEREREKAKEVGDVFLLVNEILKTF